MNIQTNIRIIINDKYRRFGRIIVLLQFLFFNGHSVIQGRYFGNRGCGRIFTGVYSWWSYMFHARENNAGWRIDYFITSASIKEKIQDSKIHTEVFGSDHCPVELDIEL